MRIKYESKTYSFFYLTILLSMGLLFSGNNSIVTYFDNAYSQKTNGASSLNNSINNINNLDNSSSQVKQQQPINKKVQFNHYENSQIGVSLKYPSNFLIDESNSNNTLRQISFYLPNIVNQSPENYILWMDVFVQTLDTAKQQQPLLSTNNFLSSYSLNLANNIQQANKDINIIGSSTNTTLSGYPAYKLITTSYIGNSAIIDVLILTIVNNTIYSIDYQTQSSNYANSLSDANKIIQSFKIISPVSSPTEGVTETQQKIAPSLSSSSSLYPPVSTESSNNKNLNSNMSNSNSALIPLLSNILSSLKIDNIANNSTNTINTLKNSISNSLNDVLSNPKNVIDKSVSGSASILQNPPPIPLLTSPSDLSSLSSDAVKKTCSIPFVSNVCNEIKNRLDNNNNNNNGKTNPVSNNNKNITNNIDGNGNNGTIREGGNNIGIKSSINNSKLDNTTIPKNNTDNLVNHDKNNSLAKILTGLLSSNSTNSSSLSLNNSKSLDDILLLESLIKYLTFSTGPSSISSPPPQSATTHINSSSSHPLHHNSFMP